MNPVGASQVTSVVRYTGAAATVEKAYRVAFSAKLHAEGVVRLVEPVPLTGELLNLCTDLCNVATDGAWKTGVRKLKSAAMALRRELDLQGELALA